MPPLLLAIAACFPDCGLESPHAPLEAYVTGHHVGRHGGAGVPLKHYDICVQHMDHLQAHNANLLPN